MPRVKSFFRDQVTTLLAFSPEVHGKWERSWIMGLSCWFYSFPGILSLYKGYQAFSNNPSRLFINILEGSLYIMTACNSFLSDHVYIGITHYSHAFDRVFATLSAVSIAVKVLFVKFTAFEVIIFVDLWAIALWMLSQSRKSRSQRDFVWNHFWWHLVSSLGMCWVISAQFNNYRNVSS